MVVLSRGCIGDILTVHPVESSFIKVYVSIDDIRIVARNTEGEQRLQGLVYCRREPQDPVKKNHLTFHIP